MTEAYKDKMRKAQTTDYTRKVVEQPTQRSNIEAQVDSSSPSGIREKKPIKSDSRGNDQ